MEVALSLVATNAWNSVQYFHTFGDEICWLKHQGAVKFLIAEFADCSKLSA